MKLKLSTAALLSSQFFFSCSPGLKSTQDGSGLFKALYSKIAIDETNPNILNGVWVNQWKNRDGYPIQEFVTVNADHQRSYTCVLNAMGGYEYSPAVVKGQSLFTTFVDPEKETYINKIGKFGQKNYNAELVYNADNDTIQWSKHIPQTYRSDTYIRLSSANQKLLDLYKSTCGQLASQTASVNVNKLKFEKLHYSLSSATVATLQSSSSPKAQTHYCVYNTSDKTVVSLPVSEFSNGSLAFSSLDFLTHADRNRFFTPFSQHDAMSLVPLEMLAQCSALSKNTRSEVKLPENDPFLLSKSYSDSLPFNEQSDILFGEGYRTKTYLVCNYSDNDNGSKAGWEWGEYPRWEWEQQKSSCSGLFASNCIDLNGHWARDDGGISAIGTMFLMDTTSKVEADFSRACHETNEFTKQRNSRFFAQYYVANSSLSLNHTVWFKQTDVDNHFALPFDRVIVFGDSLSDNGNLHTATAGIVGGAGYYQGRFTNGPVWPEYLSKKMGLDMYDWAVAASPSNAGSIFDLFKTIPYTLQSELSNFTAAVAEVGMTQSELSKMLFTILIGGNNYIFDVRSTPEGVSEDVINFADSLVKLGAKHIIVINIPDVGCTPKFENEHCDNTQLRHQVMRTNALIAESVKSYKVQHPEVTFYTVDLFKIADDIMLNPENFYVKNTKDRCYSGGYFGSYSSSQICNTPETHMFWDGLHPSTSLHCQVSDHGINSLLEKHNKPKIPINHQGCVLSLIH